jgi:hypothetical protein
VPIREGERVRRVIFLASFAAVVSVGAAAATSVNQPPLPTSNLFAKGGIAAPLRAGVTYQANRSFPIALRLTPPDGSWSGAQWKTSARGENSKRPPFFGWADVEQGVPQKGTPPHGAITIMTSFARTLSATATATYLRTRGHGATYEATTSVRLAGFSGSQFDGKVVGKQHAFIPFTPQSRIARYYGDALHLDKGEAFRIIVLNVRGKTVVVYLDSGALPADQFPAFLRRAGAILNSLKFPG